MRFNHYKSSVTALLCTVALGWMGSPWAQSRRSGSPPFKQLPSAGYGNQKVGYAITKDTISTGPDTATMCKDVKAVIKAAGNDFVSLRGAPKRGAKEGVSVWESTKGVQEFSNCAVYRAESLGDYVMCVTNTECSKGKDDFHAMSAALMSCLKNWNWQDGQMGTWRDDQQRMVTASNDEGLRITFELARAKDSWGTKCDLSLSIEIPSY